MKRVLTILLVFVMVIQFVPMTGFAIGRVGTPPDGWNLNTPGENTFKLASDTSKTFILLDSNLDDENSTFFVMTKDDYGYKEFSTSDNTTPMKFDVENPKNIAWWLNTDDPSGFKKAGNGGKILPAGILGKIDYNHVWTTEAGNASSGFTTDYNNTCGIALMSQTEWNTYYRKFGIVDSITTANWCGWWLRSSASNDGATNQVLYTITYVNPNNDATRTQGCTTIETVTRADRMVVRPVFYLKKEFFKTVKLDVDSLGDSVKAAIVAACPYESDDYDALVELEYTVPELISIGYTQLGAKPTVSNVSMSVTNYGPSSYSKTFRAGATLTGTYTYDGSGEGATSFAWVSCATESGNYTSISGATGNTYTVQNSDAGKYIKFQVTPKSSIGVVGDSFQSAEAKQVPASLGPVGRLGAGPVGYQKNTPPENIFKLADGSTEEFILLDDSGSGTSKFFIMAKDLYGSHIFDTIDTQKFDEKRPENIAYWLNDESGSGFLTTGNGGKSLPSGIINNIDENHIWLTEAGNPNGDTKFDYETKAGVAFLSQTEYKQYYSKFGIKDSINTNYWMLRTSRGDVAATNVILAVNLAASGAAEGETQTLNSTTPITSPAYLGVRPVFYLDENFFKNVKLDFASMGRNVKNAIIDADYDLSDMQALGYSDVQLTNIGFDTGLGTKPVVTNPRVGVSYRSDNLTSTFRAGTTLTALYDYEGNGKSEVGSSYTWLKSTTENGTYTEISGATGSTYVIQSSDAGNYIKYRVKPKNEADVEGDTVDSSPTAQKVVASLGPIGRLNSDVMPKPITESTPESNIFNLNNSDKEFILIDTTGDDDSKFFVMAKDTYGSKAFDYNNDSNYVNGKYNVKFDSERTDNMAYWLNNGFKTGGNGTGNKLPDGIITYIDYNHIWLTEAGFPDNGNLNAYDSNAPYDYETKAGIALLSQEEYKTYASKFGVTDDITETSWLLRSSRGIDYAQMLRVIANGADKGETNTIESRNGTANICAIRPVFYLKKGFFADVKLDLNNLGDDVLAAIQTNYTYRDLAGGAAGYTYEEITEILGIKPDYMIESCALTAQDGVNNPNYSAGGSLKAVVEISNNTGVQRLATLAVAVYDGETLLKLDFKPATLTIDGNASDYLEFDFINAVANPSVKVFVWDDFTNLIPLTEIKHYPNGMPQSELADD